MTIWKFLVQSNQIKSRSNHPSNSKPGGAGIYYILHLRVLDIQYFRECINIELKIGDMFCYINAFYRSRSHSQCQFENSSKKLKLNLDSLFKKISS